MTTGTPSLSIVEQFTTEAAAAGATVHGPVDADGAIALAARIAHDTGLPKVMAWDDDALGVPGAWARLRGHGITPLPAVLPAEKTARLSALAELGAVSVGLTSVDGALADTGTLVLASGPGRARLAWLLPAQHVAFVRTTDIRPDMATLFADRSGPAVDRTAHVAFVTGPSRTADIELTLTRGVHGPKTVHIILVSSAADTPPEPRA